MMRKKTFVSALLSVIAAAQFACAGDTVLSAERPRDEAFRTALKMEMSTLNIPIESSTDELAALLNKSVPKDLYKGSTQSRGLSATVVRNGFLTVTAADNFLYITLPVLVTFNYGMFEARPIPVTLRFKASAGITPDWRVTTDIYYLGLSDLMTEEIKIGPVSIKLRQIVDGLTQPVQKIISGQIAQKINDQFPLKAQIAKVWGMAQKPILLDKNYSAWLKLSPREVMLYPLTAQNNRVRLSVGISAFAELFVGPEPVAPAPAPLPNLKQVTTFDKNFRIALNTDIFFKDLLAILSSRLINKPIETDGKTIIIKDLDIYGNGEKLVVKLQTEGSLDGQFYLTARPVFNPQTNEFAVEDVDFEMQTQSLLLRTANWFLHSAIRSIIQSKLNMNLTKQLEETRRMAGNALAKVQLIDHVYLKGDIKKLQFNDVVVQKEKLSIRIYSDGELGVRFQ